MSLWHRFGLQLGHPRGLGGLLTGHFMRLVNRAPNRHAIAALRLIPGDEVLELGFGPGEAIAAMMSVSDVSVTGVDGSAVMLAQASRRNRSAIGAGRVHLELGDFERLSFPADRFAKVLAVNVAYFWSDPTAVVREIRRVLRPGGRLVIYATAASSMRHWKFAGEETHRLVDSEQLRDALLAAGFAPHDVAVREMTLAGGVVGIVVTGRCPAVGASATATPPTQACDPR